MNTPTLKSFFDILPGGLLITDTDSRVLYASRALERRTGFSVAEIIGKKPGELWGGQMGKTFYQSLWHTIGNQAKPFVGTMHNVRKNGSKNREQVYIAPLKDKRGVTRYFAEIHPEFSNEKSVSLFVQTFLNRAERFHEQGDALAWIVQSLGQQKDGSSVSVAPQLFSGHLASLTEVFRECLITPAEQSLVRRFEDAPLILAAQEHPEAFSVLYEKYFQSVQSYFLRRLFGDQSLAEDLTQEVFVRAFHYLPSFRLANASYYTYLLHVCHSVLMNYYRKQRQSPFSFSDERMAGMSDDASYEKKDDLRSLLAPLGEKEQIIMLLKYQDGLRVKEIAQKIGKTENAIKLILSRSRKRLGKALK